MSIFYENELHFKVNISSLLGRGTTLLIAEKRCKEENFS